MNRTIVETRWLTFYQVIALIILVEVILIELARMN